MKLVYLYKIIVLMIYTAIFLQLYILVEWCRKHSDRDIEIMSSIKRIADQLEIDLSETNLSE